MKRTRNNFLAIRLSRLKNEHAELCERMRDIAPDATEEREESEWADLVKQILSKDCCGKCKL